MKMLRRVREPPGSHFRCRKAVSKGRLFNDKLIDLAASPLRIYLFLVYVR